MMNLSVIYSALCACFGLAPDSAEASLLIREAYRDPENAPRPPRHANVIYYSVGLDLLAKPKPSAGAANPLNVPHIASASRISAWKLNIVCYGPGARDYARRIRSFLFLEGAGYPRTVLRKAGIRLDPCPLEPMSRHVPEGSLWRIRSDLTISFRAEETREHPVRRNAVKAAPAVRMLIPEQAVTAAG